MCQSLKFYQVYEWLFYNSIYIYTVSLFFKFVMNLCKYSLKYHRVNLYPGCGLNLLDLLDSEMKLSMTDVLLKKLRDSRKLKSKNGSKSKRSAHIRYN